MDDIYTKSPRSAPTPSPSTPPASSSPATRPATRRTSTACSATARCIPWAASAAATSGTWKTASRTAPTACCPTVGAATATSSPSTRNSWSWPRKTDKKRDGSRRLFFIIIPAAARGRPCRRYSRPDSQWARPSARWSGLYAPSPVSHLPCQPASALWCRPKT